VQSIRAAGADVKSEWRYNSATPIRLHDVHRENCTSLFEAFHRPQIRINTAKEVCTNRPLLLWRHWLFSLHGNLTLR